MYLRRIKTKKEKDEALFFDYEEVIAKKVKYVLEKNPKKKKKKRNSSIIILQILKRL